MQKWLQFFRSKKALVLIPIIVIGVWLVFTKIIKAKQSAPQYQTAQVESGTLVVSVSSAGQVSATNSRAVSTNVAGVVKNVFVKNDQVVQAGAKLAEITLDQETQQSYTQASATYQSAKNAVAAAQATQYSLQAAMLGKWDTFKTLAESDTYKDPTSANRAVAQFNIPQEEWLAAEAQYKNQQAVLAQAQTSLSSAAQTLRLTSPIIYAPIGGKVTGLSLMTGNVISRAAGSATTTTGQTIATITTDARPTVTVNLTEIDVTKITLGNKVTITLDALPDKTYTGKVISIDTTGAVSSGVTSYPAVIVFDSEAPEVFANMSAQANIITATKTDVLLIPSSAVQTQNGQSTMRVMKNGQPQSVSVEVGLSSSTQTEIVSGVSEGDTVVTSETAATTRSTTQARSPFSGLGGGVGGGGGARFGR